MKIQKKYNNNQMCFVFLFSRFIYFIIYSVCKEVLAQNEKSVLEISSNFSTQ